MLLLYFKRSRASTPLLLVLLGALASLSPFWFLSTSQAYLDPSYHFYAFGPKIIEPLNMYLFFPFFDAMIAVNQGFGPFLFTFGLAGACLLYKKTNGLRFEDRFALAWLVAIFLLSELFLLKLGARFAMLLTPVAALFAAYSLNHLLHDRKSYLRALTVLILVAMILPYTLLGVIGFKSARISYESNTLIFNLYLPPPTHEEFLRDSYGPILDGIDYINKETPAGSKVLTNLPLTYLFNRTVYYTGTIGGIAAQPNFDAALDYLKENGVYYIVIADADVADDPYANNPIQNNLGNVRLRQLYENVRVSIYEIRW